MKKIELATNKISVITTHGGFLYITCTNGNVYIAESIIFCVGETTICFNDKTPETPIYIPNITT